MGEKINLAVVPAHFAVLRCIVCYSLAAKGLQYLAKICAHRNKMWVICDFTMLFAALSFAHLTLYAIISLPYDQGDLC